jgi:glutathionylspermidine synthase
MEEELSKAKQEHQECQDYMDSFAVQINSKIAELDIEKEELQRVRISWHDRRIWFECWKEVMKP